MPRHSSRCLVIDDQAESIALLISYFEHQAIDIMVALDGQDGIAKALLGRPDLILMDVSMPGLDGFSVCRRLKEDVRTKAIPVIFLSGRDALEDKLEGFAAGAVDYITKPFSEAEVLARVTIHIHAKRCMDKLEAAAGKRTLDRIGVSADPEEVLFGRAVELLEQRLHNPPALIELAHTVGTNERKLTQIFRRKAGVTVFDFLTELRLDMARRLLEGSSLQIQIVSDRVGYSNSGDFTRAFRRRYGASPRAYRQSLGVQVEDPA